MSDQKDKDQIKESDSNLQTEELEKVVENINSSESTTIAHFNSFI